MSKILITKRFEFEAAHRLRLLPESHKCSRMHGHNYEVEVKLYSNSTLLVDGMVIDFGIISDLIKKQCDHQYLNDIIDEDMPTAEVISHWIFTKISECLFRLQKVHVKIASVTVWETKNCSATFVPEYESDI